MGVKIGFHLDQVVFAVPELVIYLDKNYAKDAIIHGLYFYFFNYFMLIIVIIVILQTVQLLVRHVMEVNKEF